MKRFRHYRRPVDNIESTDSSDCEYSTGDSATFDMDPGLEGDMSSIDETDGGMGYSALFTSELVERLTISDQCPKPQTRARVTQYKSTADYQKELVERRNKYNKTKSATFESAMPKRPESVLNKSPEETGGLVKEMEKLRRQIKNYGE